MNGSRGTNGIHNAYVRYGSRLLTKYLGMQGPHFRFRFPSNSTLPDTRTAKTRQGGTGTGRQVVYCPYSRDSASVCELMISGRA